MKGIKTSIDNHGKILLPAKLRKELKLKAGDTLLVDRIDNELRVTSLNSVLTKIQQEFKSRITEGKSSVEEFITMKKAEQKIAASKVNKAGGKDE